MLFYKLILLDILETIFFEHLTDRIGDSCQLLIGHTLPAKAVYGLFVAVFLVIIVSGQK